jgi:hypothetical protein
MKKPLYYIALFTALIFTSACDNNKNSGQQESETNSEQAATGESPEMSALPADTAQGEQLTSQTGNLRLTEMKGSPEYLDAMLEMNAPGTAAKLKNQGKVEFQFDVKNFGLGTQTSDAANKGIANSGDGQHVHLILNNEPYIALYKPEHADNLKEGHYTVLAFLSRSYHESVKNPEAYALRQFTVGSPENLTAVVIDVNAPNMFYSRPKGEYKGADAERVMLDFYLVNLDLSKNGYKVRTTINGEEFMLTKWAPYLIEGLPAGEATIRLELLDSLNKTVPSPYNPVERKITISKQTS